MQKGGMVHMHISMLITIDQTYIVELYKGSTSLSLVHPFSLDVKGGEDT